MSDRASALQPLIVLAVVGLGHLALVPDVADPDGFYHVGHALAYLEGSPFDTSLPWATRSVIGDLGGDLWWGFHILLLPFAALGSVPVAMQSAAIALTAVLGLTVLRVLRRHDVPHPGWWAALFFLAVPNVFFRHLMVRPHVISMAASVALVSVLVRGRWWHVLLLSWLVAWVHLSLFWAGPLIAVAYGVVRVPVTVLLARDEPDTGVPIRRAVSAAFAGALLGWAMRPDPVATATLLNVQLVELFAQKALDRPLNFAAELSPIEPAALVASAGSFLAAWLFGAAMAARAAGTGGLARLGQARTTLLVLCLCLSAAFLGLALLSARRAMEQWVAFGFLVLPLVALARGGTCPQRWAVPLRVVGVVLLAVHLGWFARRHMLNRASVAIPATTLQPIAEHLRAHSEPGEPVFHARWDNFGPLFAFNRHNRYLGGMDPIFQYAHDPQSYWEFFYLSSELTQEWTCDAWPCLEGTTTDTYQALKEHFGVRWVVVQPYRNPRLSLYFLNDDRYALVLETQSAALFELVGP